MSMSEIRSTRFNIDPTVAVGLVLTAGLVLRLLGVSHGFPDFVTGDERVVTTDAVRFIHMVTLQPQHFNYPALYSYLYSAALVGASLIELMPDVGSLAASVTFTHLFVPTQVALVGRVVNVLAGTGLIAVTCALGNHAYGRPVGLGAALRAILG